MIPTLLAADILSRRIEQAASEAPPPPIARETAYFRAEIGKVESPEDLIADFRLYRYVMTAFDLSDALGSQAIVRKVLEEGTDDRDDLANRLSDSKFRELADTLGFSVAGNLKLQLPNFLDEVAARYQRAQLEIEAGETNNAARLSSYFDRRIVEADSWFEVLADRPLRDVVFTTLRLPEAMQTLDVDRLKAELEDRYDLADFQDAEKRADFLRRFAIFSDLGGAGGSSPSSSALQLLVSARTTGPGLSLRF